MVGTVKIRRGNGPKWIDARPNMPLFQSDAVRTFVESEAELATFEGTVISLGENTTLELSTFSQSSPTEQQTQIRILSGKVLSNVAKLTSTKSKFEFETPTATAAIRGTRVGFDVTGNQTQIRVYEGKVYVTPKGASSGAELQTDQMTTVKQGQKTVEIEVLQDPAPPAAPDTTTVDTTVTDSVTSDTTASPGDTLGTSTTSDTLSRNDQDSTEISSRDTTSSPVELTLTVTSPTSGQDFETQDEIAVKGQVTPAEALVAIRGKPVTVSSSGEFSMTLVAPKTAGTYNLEIRASLGDKTKQVSIPFGVSAAKSSAPLTLAVTTPATGLEVSAPLIQVGGTTTPGATVQCAGLELTVASDGTFRGQVPIADEEGEHVMEIEATLEGVSKTISRTVHYQRDKEELRITLSVPYENQKFTTTSIPVRGVISLTDAQVTVVSPVRTMSLAVGAGGGFSGMIDIPEEGGTHEVEIEVIAGDQVQTLTRSVAFEKPPDTNVPLLSGSIPQCVRQGAHIFFSVTDRTPDDEITFYREIDGSEETEVGGANATFSVTLEEGCHEYRIWAIDREGNRSREIVGSCCFQPRPLSIHLRAPAGGQEMLRLPPGAPNSDFAPIYTIQFRIENLPDDFDAVQELIREVTITNSANGATETVRNLTDIDVELDIELERETTNPITIRVVDVCDQIFTSQAAIHVQ